MSLVLRLPRKMHLYSSSSNVPRLPLFETATKPFTFWPLLARCRIRCACHVKWKFNIQNYSLHFVLLRACAFLTSQLPKVVRTCVLMCVQHFDLEMPRATTACTFSTSRCFSEPTFRPWGSSKHWKKHSVSRLFLPFPALWSSLSWLFLFCDFFSSVFLLTLLLLLHLSISQKFDF